MKDSREELFAMIHNTMLKDCDKDSRIWFSDTSWHIADAVFEWHEKRIEPLRKVWERYVNKNVSELWMDKPIEQAIKQVCEGKEK